MLFLYNLFILLYGFVIRMAALVGNAKAKLWIKGRENIFEVIHHSLKQGERRVWFHCASLGEFEQGRPVMEKFKIQHPEFKIVLTFFSPSGYEVRKNYSGADSVFYLPIDTRSNAEKFISLVNPEKVFFVKYEYWFHYFEELNKRNIPNYMVSAIVRPQQRFFQWYGGFFRKMLKTVSHFFVQDEQSASLLKSIGISNCTVTGDTRFDRVAEIASNAKPVLLVEKFCAGKKIIVAGSTWEKDEQVIRASLSDLHPGYKLILASHEINEGRINHVLNSFSDFKTVKLSEVKEESVSSADILIIDNIGMLSSLYRYGMMAYIGGGFGSGIHNILEAAVYGMPVFFGPNYKRFREANEMIRLGGAFSVSSSDELKAAWMNFLNDETKLKIASDVSKKYVEKRTGATEKIMEFIKSQ